MAKNDTFEEDLMKVVRSDPRYSVQAYYLIYEGLDYTQRLLERQGHVTGQELAEGIRLMVLDQFGLMARTVLKSWGIKSTEDFGELVFSLVQNGLLKKTAEDSRDDFKDIYDFSEAFEERFEFEFQGE